MPYMSPEQLRGEAIDGRSDVFSAGTVLYQAVAGTHPFTRGSWAETISAILTSDPPVDAVPGPPELRRIVRKCLEKDRERRYQTMSDLAIDLENIAREITAPALPAIDRDARKSGAGRRLLPWIAAIAVVAALAIGAGLLRVWRAPAALSPADYQQITDFSDATAAPALSPDGQMVVFIRGSDPGSLTNLFDPSFLNRTGQIYVKRLPNGDAIRLTNDPRPKLGPVFTPDGSRIAYTAVEVLPDKWSTFTVPISGGEPTRLLPNAAGLQWIDERRILFSQIQEGSKLHMALVTSTQDRADARTLYVPEHVRGMAHFSYISPDKRSVLVVEMGPTGEFVRCRLVPFDNASAARDVGPDGVCRSAGWSPDGRWMYFSAIVGGASHLWRQRFPDGVAEPLTSGSATEEHGVAVAPDGRSLITALGRRRSTLWLHDDNGERMLSSEGFAFAPVLGASGARLYYLLRRAPTFETVELTRLEIASGKTERLLSDYSILDFDISRDETEVAFTTATPGGEPQIWVAALDRSSAPRLIVRGGDDVAFGPDGDLLFRQVEGHANYVVRVTRDGKARTRVSDMSVVRLQAVSPDGRWIVTASTEGEGPTATFAMSVDTGAARQVCAGLCWVGWSPDGRALHIWHLTPGVWRDVAVPLPAGQVLPEFPSGDIPAFSTWSKLSGAKSFDRPVAVPTNDLSSYVFLKNDDQRNLFRIPLQPQ
jgi:Tol biopolymer transport system component